LKVYIILSGASHVDKIAYKDKKQAADMLVKDKKATRLTSELYETESMVYLIKELTLK